MALVAGATRGCGRALAVDLVRAAGGTCEALVVDHEDHDQVRTLVERIESDHGRLDVLVNDIFGGDRYAAWDTRLWEHDLTGGSRMLRMGIDTHLVTSTFAIPADAAQAPVRVCWWR